MEVQNIEIRIGPHIQLADIENNEPLTLGLLLCWLTNKSSSFVRYQQRFGQT